MSADGTPRDAATPSNETGALSLRTVSSIAEIEVDQWDAHAFPKNVPYNPFVAHRFLKLLEESGSIAEGTGWHPNILVLEQGDKILGMAPAYLKGHSQGEYIFDHAWADAYQRAGGRYFPKLLIAAPFTPAPGPRLLCADSDHRVLLAGAIRQFTDQTGLSSAHINFITQAERTLLEAEGYLARLGEQFHWTNRDYQNFDDFLAALASRKRKTIRQERRKATEQGIRIENITGRDLKEHHWDSFWVFYQDTGLRKWGTPYLTRDAFSLLGERMADDLLLTLAFTETGTDPIAGALHFIGGDTLYGRYWGCTEQAKFLHFECCYYQAIDYAIDHGLARVEAGAQGTHKLARGYEPVPTFSAHYLPDPNFREAVSRYLAQERMGVAEDIAALKNYTPFKKSN